MADQQQKRITGIAAAAMEGAREGESDAAAKQPGTDQNREALARPGPGMKANPDAPPSTTNQYTGITGGVTEDQDDEDQEWRRAGGGDPDA